MKIQSLTSKRIIIEAMVNGKKGKFLVDTGASVGLIDESRIKKYDLIKGRAYNGTIIGAGGELSQPHICNSFIEVGNKRMAQFLLTDIKDIRRSIEHETGHEILGIISLSQLQAIGATIDTDDCYLLID